MTADTAALPDARGPTGRPGSPLLMTVPEILPERVDGKPVRLLSPTSFRLFKECPEAWRLRHIVGIKAPLAWEAVLGKAVDYPVMELYRARIRGDDPEPGDIERIFTDNLPRIVAEEQARQGIDWADLAGERELAAYGLPAIRTFMSEFAPTLGQPVAVQRELRFTVAPNVQWDVVCHLDLEVRRRHAADRLIESVVDLKVSADNYDTKAARDIQCSSYLTGRFAEGHPADEFAFAALQRPATPNGQWAARRSVTHRRESDLWQTIFRYAEMAQHIWELYDARGPEARWPLAGPNASLCDARFCMAFDTCPGGATL